MDLFSKVNLAKPFDIGGPTRVNSLNKEEKTARYRELNAGRKLRRDIAKRNGVVEEFKLGNAARSARGGAFSKGNKETVRLCSKGIVLDQSVVESSKKSKED
jgi:hypothetical protein